MKVCPSLRDSMMVGLEDSGVSVCPPVKDYQRSSIRAWASWIRVAKWCAALTVSS